MSTTSTHTYYDIDKLLHEVRCRPITSWRVEDLKSLKMVSLYRMLGRRGLHFPRTLFSANASGRAVSVIEVNYNERRISQLTSAGPSLHIGQAMLDTLSQSKLFPHLVLRAHLFHVALSALRHDDRRAAHVIMENGKIVGQEISFHSHQVLVRIRRFVPGVKGLRYACSIEVPVVCERASHFSPRISSERALIARNHIEYYGVRDTKILLRALGASGKSSLTDTRVGHHN